MRRVAALGWMDFYRLELGRLQVDERWWILGRADEAARRRGSAKDLMENHTDSPERSKRAATSTLSESVASAE